VSSLYVARSDAGRRAVDDLSGQPLLAPRPGQPVVEVNHVDWHHRQVFKGVSVEAVRVIRTAGEIPARPPPPEVS